MAKRTASSEGGSRGKKAPARAQGSERTGEVTVDVAEVAAAVNALPQPSELMVRAWREQYPESYVLAQAAQTRASAVVGEAWGWFQKARPSLEGPLGGTIRYPLERLAFLGHCILDLAGALEAERAKKRKASGLTTAKTSAEALAQATLTDVRSAMREAAGRHPALQDDLDKRLKEPASATTSGELHGLAGLLESWLSHASDVVRALVASHRLTAADVTSARAHGDALTRAATKKRGQTASDRDSPEVSLLEGRLLVEMRALRNAFVNARARAGGDKRIPALAPSPATRAVFGRDREAPVAEAPPAATGAADAPPTR